VQQKLTNYINGRAVPPVGGAYIDNVDPACGEVYAFIPDSDARDVDAAVDAAQRAFPAWSATSVEKRSHFLTRLADLLERDLEKFARAESIDTGKPLSLARSLDIPRAISNFRFFAAAITQFSSEAHAMGESGFNYTLRNAIGVAGCISPWNLPLYLFTWKIAPALAAGNCVVAKPSELTPMTAWMLGELCAEAGIPPGVLNIVHGYGKKVGAAVSAHPGIPVITFTGGTATGRDIAGTAAPLFKKLSLEMGGKNPTIICSDCEYEKMIDTVVRSSFLNQGEICLCGSRILIERSLYDRFKEGFVAEVQRLRVGDPLLAETTMGAINSRQHFEKVLSYIDLAQKEGGTILTGGKPVNVGGRCAQGWFIEPTVVEGLPQSCRTNQEEIFGPVVTIAPFGKEEEALALANDTHYGLASSLWTTNLARAHRMAAKIQTGIVWVNCWMVRDLRTPFGGMKNSGVGREGGWEALRFFTEPKNICIKVE
jgi:aminomuconate-semialdehyde/2-hydroxymuconate-6-semialdehyde dehydrogenase